MSLAAFPFTAFVGQERVRTALILSAIDHKLGGVLISGPKGSGKSTLVRGLGDILPEMDYVAGCSFNCDPHDAAQLCPMCAERMSRDGSLPAERRRMRIVELPLGASEDSLLGTIDPEEALKRGVKV